MGILTLTGTRYTGNLLPKLHTLTLWDKEEGIDRDATRNAEIENPSRYCH